MRSEPSARSSVILTGVETILADNPAMNVRLDGTVRQPLRVVLDSRLRSPPESRIFDREGASLVVGVVDDAARRAARVAARAQVELAPADAAGRPQLRAVLQSCRAAPTKSGGGRSHAFRRVSGACR
jgi:diaminohydroxyphosphoribosylaminopyrimidine deaminase/5-amino-6-(5-phosphoribosylamino)uracil reductase